jgi:hypothetical protein
MKQTFRIQNLLLSTILLSGLAVSVPTAAAASNHHWSPGPAHMRNHLYNASSTNWAGYATLTSLTNPKPGSVTQASGSWTVPTANCAGNNLATYSATWVGLDGYSDQTVEQTGTEQDCQGTTPQYSAWFEMYPDYAYSVNLAVHPGDHMQATVKYDGWSMYTLTLKDLTTSKTFSTDQWGFGARRESAEWITEAPSDNQGVLPLTKLSPVTFTGAQATVNGVSGTISKANRVDDPITLVDQNNKPVLTPSALDTAGDSFTLN